MNPLPFCKAGAALTAPAMTSGYQDFGSDLLS